MTHNDISIIKITYSEFSRRDLSIGTHFYQWSSFIWFFAKIYPKNKIEKSYTILVSIDRSRRDNSEYVTLGEDTFFLKIA